MDIHTAMRIARNPDFQDRVKFLMEKLAITSLNGTPTSPDILLGQRILDAGEDLITWSIASLAGSTAIMAGAHSETGATILDGDLETSITALWPAFRQ